MKLLARLPALLLALVIVAPTVHAQAVDEKPNGFAMVGDLVVARPIGLVMTAVGAAAFVVSLPFTALAGHVSESAETLVLGPGDIACAHQPDEYLQLERIEPTVQLLRRMIEHYCLQPQA